MTIYVTKFGDDDNDGLTKQTAVATIAKAFSLATVGCTVAIGVGRYTWNSIVSTLPDNVCVKGDTNGALTGTGKGVVVIEDNGGSWSFELWKAENIELLNLVIKNVSNAPYQVALYSSKKTWKIINCVLASEKWGVSTSNTLYNCTVIGYWCFASNVGTPIAENCILCRNGSETSVSGNNYVCALSDVDKIFINYSADDYRVKNEYISAIKNKGIVDANTPMKDMMHKSWRGNPWYGALGYEKSVYYSYLNVHNEIYGMGDEMFTKLSDNWSALTDAEKKTLFESTNYDTASVEDLATLGKFKVLNYSETNDKPELAVSAAPKDKLVLSRGFMRIEDIEGIDKATLTKTLSGSGICKLLVTDDMKTYYAYDFDTKVWKVVDHKMLATVKTSGIDAAKFADIDRTVWDKLLKGKSGVGFAYLMAIEAVADQCAMDKLVLQVDKKGKWAQL